ncbi:MAG: hypothetical protein SPF92_09130 [Clostridia bacterium]|nr:hypothetical protein [Clostridia bacterium]
MGLFTPKISSSQLATVNGLLKKANESADIINKTVQPDVFFRRICFLLFCLKELKLYEKYKIFKGNNPTNEYNSIIKNLENTVDNFIDRSYHQALNKANTYKTEKAKMKFLSDYAISLICAFENPHQFNDVVSPLKYTGTLYCEKNYNKVVEIVRSIDANII